MPPDVLIHGDTHRSAALRHELPLGIIDPFSYFEVERPPRGGDLVDGGRPGRGGGPRRRGDRPVRARPRRADRPGHALGRARARAVRPRRGAASARAGSWCRASCRWRVADRLRADGIEVVPDEQRVHPAAALQERRRGRGRAPRPGRRRRHGGRGRAAARRRRRRLLRRGRAAHLRGGARAHPRGVRRPRRAGSARTSSSPPARPARPATRTGTGPLPAGVPIIIDIWPRDERSGCFADMTRTFVRGGEPADDVAPPGTRSAARARARLRAAAAGRDRPGPVRRRLRRLRGGRRADPAHQARGRAAARRLLPLARPRRRARGARGAVAGPHRRAPSWWPATWSRSSPAATATATAACAWRTSCSSPRTATSG